MRRSFLGLCLAVTLFLGGGGYQTAYAQPGGAAPSSGELPAPRGRFGAGASDAPAPGSRLGSDASPPPTFSPRYGEGATEPAAPGSRFGGSQPGAPTAPAAGGGLSPLEERDPLTPPATTQPPVRGLGPMSDDALPAPGDAGAGDIPRYGNTPVTDPALDPPADPALAPSVPSVPDSRYSAPADPLDDRGALPAADDKPALDRDNSLPSPNDRPSPPSSAAPEAHRPTKFVYRNPLATFHLVEGEGTVHYHLKQPAGKQPPVCVDGFCPIGETSILVPQLALLRGRSTSDPNYLHFTPEHGDQQTIEWAVALNPSQDGCYAVYRRTEKGWSRFGSFVRQAIR
jgi:hypothetical protein